jgi:hypothetical protein
MSKNSLRSNLQSVMGWMESKKIIKRNSKGRLENPKLVSRFNRSRKK